MVLDHPFLAELVLLASRLDYEVVITADRIEDPVLEGGITLYESGRIHLMPGKGELDYFPILTHELGHVLLHGEKSRREQMTRHEREAEANAVVRLVLDARSGDPHLTSHRTRLASVFASSQEVESAARTISANLPRGNFYPLP
jgi:hypothetical protein